MILSDRDQVCSERLPFALSFLHALRICPLLSPSDRLPSRFLPAFDPEYDLAFALLVLRPGYGLTPSPKAQTLPTCLDMQRSCDLDLTDLGTPHSYCKSSTSLLRQIQEPFFSFRLDSHDGDQNKSVKVRPCSIDIRTDRSKLLFFLRQWTSVLATVPIANPIMRLPRDRLPR